MKKINKIICTIMFCILIGFNSLQVYAENSLEIDAKSAVIVEKNTGKIIYDKDANKRNYPASVTKVLTAILVLENCKLEDTATVSKTAISNIPDGYVVAPLFIGEKIAIKDLLYALMLKSANDAAYVLAEHVGGSVEGFSDMMNKKAKEIGCKDSHFVNPNGIHNENHYTTAYDMYLISQYAMKNETFQKIVSTNQYTLEATNKYPNKNRIMQNTNSFINPRSAYYNKNVKGIKTGTTTQAGNCLITEADKDGLNYITVVLGAKTSNSKFSETQKMINYSFENYTLTKMREKGDKIKTIEVEKATEETKNLDLVISNDVTVMKNVNLNLDEIEPEILLNEEIVAPISEGQEMGTVKYNVDGLEYEAKLLAGRDVERSYFMEILIFGGATAVVLIIIIAVVKRRRG